MGFALVAFLFGLIIGSFLNVLVIRSGVRTLSGRSACMSCGQAIYWYDNIPVLSWLVLSGRCRRCKSAISVQYPLVELLTGIVFGLIGYPYGVEFVTIPPILPIVLSFAIAAIYIAIAVYDMRHTIIPNGWAYAAAILAFVLSLVTLSPNVSFLAFLFAGPIAALPLFLLWLFSRGVWMGLGDSKLALSIGWLLGPVYGLYAVFLAFVIGALVSLLVLLPLPTYLRFLRKQGIARLRVGDPSLTMKSEVPFGPFLIAGAFAVWFLLLYAVPMPLIFYI